MSEQFNEQTNQSVPQPEIPTPKESEETENEQSESSEGAESAAEGELSDEQVAKAHQDIAQFKELFSELPENTELQMVDGKVCLIGKVNGVPETFTLEDIVRNAMKNRAGEQLMDSAKEEAKKIKDLRSQTIGYMKHLMSNPEEYYRQRRAMGISDKEDHEYFAQKLEEMIAYEQMTDEQKELYVLRKEKEARIKQDEEKQKEAQAAKERQEITELEEKYSSGIIEALKSNGITVDADERLKENVFQSTLYYMLVAEQNGHDYSPTRAVKEVLKDMKASIFHTLGKMSDDQIRAIVPENVKKAIIGSDSTAGIRSIPTSRSIRGVATQAEEEHEEPRKKKKHKSMNDFFSNL